MRNTEAILAKGRFRTEVFKFSFLNRIVDLWNGVRVAIRTINQLSLFSKKMNQFYISKINLNKDKFSYSHFLILYCFCDLSILVFYVFYMLSQAVYLKYSI